MNKDFQIPFSNKGIFLLIAFFLISCQTKGNSTNQESLTEKKPTHETTKIPYHQFIKNIEQQRRQFKLKYIKAKSKVDKELILTESAEYLHTAINTLSIYWLGTEWNFYGTSKIPQKGKIACGYFVANLLLDSGFKTKRSKLAQQAAIYIIKTFAHKKSIHHYSNLSIKQFVTRIKKLDDGLYIVGLDKHVGLISKHKGELIFIHSSYYKPPFAVTRDDMEDNSPLTHSKYRVIGNILNPDTIKKWLLGQTFYVKRR